MGNLVYAPNYKIILKQVYWEFTPKKQAKRNNFIVGNTALHTLAAMTVTSGCHKK